jgi:hypothetical protein
MKPLSRAISDSLSSVILALAFAILAGITPIVARLCRTPRRPLLAFIAAPVTPETTAHV